MKVLVWLMLTVVAVWTASGVLVHLYAKNAGEFGDMFGAVNSLFSGLAFAGIIYTIFLQRHELKLQREELTDTRKVLEGQKEQLERQAFENTFFHMLTLHNQIVASFTYRPIDAGKDIHGKQCFQSMKDDLRRTYLRKPETGGSVEERYKKYYLAQAHDTLGHYFRNLYQILKYVKNSPVKDKKFYTNIVRAQLSSAELFLLFFNTLSEYGSDKFRPLIIEFEFLEHLPYVRGQIENADAVRYGVGAFGKSLEWAESLNLKTQ